MEDIQGTWGEFQETKDIVQHRDKLWKGMVAIAQKYGITHDLEESIYFSDKTMKQIVTLDLAPGG